MQWLAIICGMFKRIKCSFQLTILYKFFFIYQHGKILHNGTSVRCPIFVLSGNAVVAAHGLAVDSRTFSTTEHGLRTPVMINISAMFSFVQYGNSFGKFTRFGAVFTAVSCRCSDRSFSFHRLCPNVFPMLVANFITAELVL